TTPLIFKFLEETNKAKSITIMVQKEVAQEIVAKAGEENYGILSVMLAYYCDSKITRIVKKQMFTPRPKVDSAVIRLTRKSDVQFNKAFSNFVGKIFAMKRKTLYNNLTKAGYDKTQVLETLKNNNLREDVRAEKLALSQIRQIFFSLNKKI
ncbi:MAG: 16S rRNA (adenine(1518)-N(6)/adenine(1519)-N(6))-dimethyltransferase, partial [Clostridia bacterium]|nr:16S rRNA (adenine(1518)-N(6)/adenine(1519)-N(6))-dimethyltransferase [Clostridia bacterium]